jgi:hypothetical protein
MRSNKWQPGTSKWATLLHSYAALDLLGHKDDVDSIDLILHVLFGGLSAWVLPCLRVREQKGACLAAATQWARQRAAEDRATGRAGIVPFGVHPGRGGH